MRAILVALILSIAGCAVAPNRYDLEGRAYGEYLLSEVKAGRMTMEQANYLAQQKMNQLQSQRQADRAASSADTMNTLNLLNQMQRAQQPTFLPSPTLNCTTFHDGRYSQTNCR